MHPKGYEERNSGLWPAKPLSRVLKRQEERDERAGARYLESAKTRSQDPARPRAKVCKK